MSLKDIHGINIKNTIGCGLWGMKNKSNTTQLLQLN